MASRSFLRSHGWINKIHFRARDCCLLPRQTTLSLSQLRITSLNSRTLCSTAPIQSKVFTELRSRPHTKEKSNLLSVKHSQQQCFRASSGNTVEDEEKVEEVVDTEGLDSVHLISDTEKVQGPLHKHDFQAETRQLLDIVARSLYSEREVFIREIVSNSSDALEKLRHLQLTGAELTDQHLPFEIHITTNEEKGTFVIQDYGLGMSKEELVENLGTIARSGSKAFVKQLQEEGNGSSTAQDSIIGQFGVGFYSLFMVGDRVDVFTKSYRSGEPGLLWTSDGSGSYEIAEADGVARGTKIIVHLKTDSKRYSIKGVVEEVVRKYSNFVGFPIFLNGTKLNTVQALWMLDDKNLTSEQHEEFYQFITNTSDKPRYELVYKTDAPLNIRSLFYIPTMIPEMYAFGQIDSGVSLYSRKVLIQSKASNILPKWLRFIKGVVDSEDIPLNLSRELLQDSALIKKLSNILEARIVRHLTDQMKKDRVKYEKFFKDFGLFIREGVLTSDSQDTKEDISKLLRFESSREKPGTQKTIQQYVSNMAPGQKNIFYLCAPSRELAESSPYFEALKSQDVEVLFTYDENDDIVLHGLKEFKKKPVVSAENFLMNAEQKPQADAESVGDDTKLTESQATELSKWLSNTLGKERVNEVKVSQRLASHPAMITVPDMAAARRWLKFIKAGPNTEMQNYKYQILQPTLEINPSHDLIISLNKVKESDPDIAKLLAEQIFDNGLIAAGLMEDPREMVGRLNTLLSKTMDKIKGDSN